MTKAFDKIMDGLTDALAIAEGRAEAPSSRPKETERPEKLAYGVKDAAYAFSVSESLVWIWIREGKLKTFKVGARTLITREEMLRRLADLVAAESR